MADGRGISLAKRTVERWLAGAVLGACAIDLDDGLAAARKLPETMAALWDHAYGRNAYASVVTASQSLSIASPCERVLAQACFVLATMCDEDVLRGAVDELAHADANSDFAETMRRSIEMSRVMLDVVVGTP